MDLSDLAALAALAALALASLALASLALASLSLVIAWLSWGLSKSVIAQDVAVLTVSARLDGLHDVTDVVVRFVNAGWRQVVVDAAGFSRALGRPPAAGLPRLISPTTSPKR
jgi:hypothetical protein